MEEDRAVPPTRANSPAAGLVASAGVAVVAFAAADVAGTSLLSWQGVSGASPISGIPIALLLGCAVRNLSPRDVAMRLKTGATVASKQVLQAGIVCVGLKLSAVDVVNAGLFCVPAVAACVGVGIIVVPRLGRALGVDAKTSALISAGTTVCGVTAVTAVSPAIKASPRESSVAIANVVAFGTLGMLCYPYAAHFIFQGASTPTGAFLGLAIHDTSQVMGAAATYDAVYADELVLKTAAVTKLTRNLCLAGVVPYWTMRFAENSSTAQTTLALRLYKHTPVFVYGFIAAALLRTTGDIACASDDAAWRSLCGFIGSTLGAKVLLGTAMGGVGLSTDLSALKGVGVRPFALGLAGASSVATAGLCSAYGMHMATG